MNCKNMEINPDYSTGTYGRDRMALCKYLKITTVPELVLRLSIVFNQRFSMNEDRLVHIEMLEELTEQEI
jgi:hypothetical protein